MNKPVNILSTIKSVRDGMHICWTQSLTQSECSFCTFKALYAYQSEKILAWYLKYIFYSFWYCNAPIIQLHPINHIFEICLPHLTLLFLVREKLFTFHKPNQLCLFQWIEMVQNRAGKSDFWKCCQKANYITKSAFSAFFCLSAFFTELDF